MFACLPKLENLAAVLAVSLALSAPAAAQFGPGLTWSGSSGTHVGEMDPFCITDFVAATRGETVTLTVRGDGDMPYALLMSITATSCVPVPGVVGGLVLDAPIVPVGSGVCSIYVRCANCPQAYDAFDVVIPATTPIGMMVSLQAIGFGRGQLGLTGAITATVL